MMSIKHARAVLIRSLPESVKRTALIWKHAEEAFRQRVETDKYVAQLVYDRFRYCQSNKKRFYKLL